MRRMTTLLPLLLLMLTSCAGQTGSSPTAGTSTTPAAPASVVAVVPTDGVQATPITEPTAQAATQVPVPSPTQPAAPAAEPATANNLKAASFSVGLQQVSGGLVHPVTMATANDGSGRLFVVDQTGQIYIIGTDSTMLNQPFLDISGRMVTLNPAYDERGLLGLAFHPDYANNGRFFVYYSAPLRDGGAGEHTNYVSEFHISADPNVADPNSERRVLAVDKPQGNHNGGQIRFGPDGYLYIPLGDGGGSNDADQGHADDWYAANDGGNGQDTQQNLLGSILRIDINNGDPYGIPGDNPKGDEQWAWGFRNPYSMHFDTGGEHWLLVGDAGQNRWEEVDVAQAGGNYGWNVLEGTHCFSTDNPTGDGVGIGPCPTVDADGNPLRSPVVEFRNLNASGGIGFTVIGGTIYRGNAIPELQGMYVFGSWSSSWDEARGQLFVAQPGSPDGLWQMFALPTTDDAMGRLNTAILGFGVGEDGTLYVLTTEGIGPSGNTGKVWRIVPAGG
jgi:glucose/arabinose dehydrogenase